MSYSQTFLTKLLTLGISFSTAVRAVVVVGKLVLLCILFSTSFILALRAVVEVKLVILGILFSRFLMLTPFLLALRVVLVATLVISGILFSRVLILALNISFWATSFY